MPRSSSRIAAIVFTAILAISLMAPTTVGAPADTAELGVTTGEAADVAETSATLQGNLTELGNATTATASFEYWIDGDEANASIVEAGSLNETGTFQVTVDGLAPNTTYVVVAHANGSDGTTASGDSVSFTTDDAFDVRTQPATDVTNSSATLQGTLADLDAAESATVWFEYRQQGDDENTTATAAQTVNETGAFDASVDGLTPNVTYVYTAHAELSNGEAEAGSEVTFETVETGEEEDEAFGERVSSLVQKLQSLDGQLGAIVSEWVVANNPGADDRPDHAGPDGEREDADGNESDDDASGPPAHANGNDEAESDGEDADSDEDEIESEEEDEDADDEDTEEDDGDEDDEDTEEDDSDEDEDEPPEHANNDKDE